jgi:hypothetical protein
MRTTIDTAVHNAETTVYESLVGVGRRGTDALRFIGSNSLTEKLAAAGFDGRGPNTKLLGNFL